MLSLQLTEAILLDVHAKGVEQDFTIRPTHSFSECNSLFRRIHHELFETIDYFNLKNSTLSISQNSSYSPR
jgi:hypothetical protein